LKIFLTGGTGFIGYPLTQAFVSRGWDIVALVRKPDSPQAHALATMGVQCVAGDITDRESMRAGMNGADMVVHNAGWFEFGVTANGRRLMQAINVTGTDNVLSLALELSIPRTVYVSSTIFWGETGSQVYDETWQRQKPYRSYYEQTKAEAHKIAQGYQGRGLPLIIVCPNAVVGPNDYSTYGYFLRIYLNHLLPPFAWAPEVITSRVYVKDAAEGIALAAEKARIGETYILAGEPDSQRKMLESWMTRPGGLKVRFYIPNWLAKVLFAPLEPLQRMIGLPAVISRETVSANFSMNFSSAKAQRELGWTYVPAQKMWSGILDRELELLASREKRDLVSRLKPVETSE
jgi:dihydroflavonol-4-reductase